MQWPARRAVLRGPSEHDRTAEEQTDQSYAGASDPTTIRRRLHLRESSR